MKGRQAVKAIIVIIIRIQTKRVAHPLVERQKQQQASKQKADHDGTN